MTASPFLDQPCLPQPSGIRPLVAVGLLAQPNGFLRSMAPLRSLPQQTFGYQWWEFWQKQRLSNQSHGQQPHSPYQASLHVLTGYDCDTVGTAELCAFLLGTERNITALGIALRSLTPFIGAVVTPPSLFSLPDVWVRLYQAYCRGRQSWFELRYWQPQSLRDLPLEYVRRWFRILL